jgi:hypothetical protein
MTPVRAASMRPTALLSCLLTACAGSTLPPKGTPDPVVTKAEKDRLHAITRDAAKKNEMPQVRLDLDQLLNGYSIAMGQRGVDDGKVKNIAESIRKLVARNFDALTADAADSSEPGNQAIALASLGFAAKPEAMPVILQGAQTDNEHLVSSAILGLAVLQDAQTPPGVVIAVIENTKFKAETRIGAAWCLYRLQLAMANNAEIVAYWVQVLNRPLLETNPAIVMHAVRGLGLTRSSEHAALVAKYATHPTPHVRTAVTVALARMQAQDQVEALLALISPAETNAEVRLGANKALVALAGGEDRGYDVASWRSVFQRKAP